MTHRTVLTGLTICWLALAGPLAQAGVVTATPFRGVTHLHVTETTPATLDYHVLRIDMADPAIRFTTTPANGPDAAGDTTRQTTRAFVEQTGAQIGINANFFDGGGDAFSATCTLLGLAASNGAVVSPWTQGFDQGLNISAGNVATIIEPDLTDPARLASTPAVTPHNVISGLYRLVRGGAEQSFASDSGVLHPRTAVGVDADGDLILLIVDGRNPGHSDGMSVQTLAHTMLQLGAVEAFNLDGGGSTTLVYADTAARVVNTPVGVGNVPGSERANGNNLAIFAAAVPEPTMLGTVILLAAGTLRRRRLA